MTVRKSVAAQVFYLEHLFGIYKNYILGRCDPRSHCYDKQRRNLKALKAAADAAWEDITPRLSGVLVGLSAAGYTVPQSWLTACIPPRVVEVGEVATESNAEKVARANLLSLRTAEKLRAFFEMEGESHRLRTEAKALRHLCECEWQSATGVTPPRWTNYEELEVAVAWWEHVARRLAIDLTTVLDAKNTAIPGRWGGMYYLVRGSDPMMRCIEPTPASFLELRLLALQEACAEAKGLCQTGDAGAARLGAADAAADRGQGAEAGTGPGGTVQKPGGQQPPGEGEWSTPMSLAQLMTRLRANMDPRKFKNWLEKDHGLRRISRQSYQVCLDKMPRNLRVLLEGKDNKTDGTSPLVKTKESQGKPRPPLTPPKP